MIKIGECYKCEICDLILKHRQNVQRHVESKKHLDKIANTEKKEEKKKIIDQGSLDYVKYFESMK